MITIIGILISVTGAIIVISRGNISETLMANIGVGDAYIFGGVMSWAAYSLIGKSIMKTLSPLVAVTYSSVVGTVALFFAII